MSGPLDYRSPHDDRAAERDRPESPGRRAWKRFCAWIALLVGVAMASLAIAITVADWNLGVPVCAGVGGAVGVGLAYLGWRELRPRLPV